jgi:hypothetical protein
MATVPQYAQRLIRCPSEGLKGAAQFGHLAGMKIITSLHLLKKHPVKMFSLAGDS